MDIVEKMDGNYEFTLTLPNDMWGNLEKQQVTKIVGTKLGVLKDYSKINFYIEEKYYPEMVKMAQARLGILLKLKIKRKSIIEILRKGTHCTFFAHGIYVSHHVSLFPERELHVLQIRFTPTFIEDIKKIT